MLTVTIAAFHVIAFLSLGLTLASKLISKKFAPRELVYILTIASASLLYLLTFFIFIISPSLGKGTTILIHGLGFGAFLFSLSKIRSTKNFIGRSGYFLIPLVLTLFFLVTFVSLNEGCRTSKTPVDIDNQSYCYIEKLPADNILPFLFAGNVANDRPAELLGDWKLSDRPPMQVGTALSLRQFSKNGEGSYPTYVLVATFYQLSWIGALFGLLLLAGLRLKDNLVLLGIIGLSSFVFVNSIFVWPKFYAASLVILGFSLLFVTSNRMNPRYFPVAFLSIALGLLTHTGVLFTIVGMAAIFSFYYLKNFGIKLKSDSFRYLIASCLLSGLLLFSWLAYKTTVNPIDRLTKWHFAGVISEQDSRGTLETIVDEYRELTWNEWLEGRTSNFKRLINPFADYQTTRQPGDNSLEHLTRWIRVSNFYIFSASLGLLSLGFIVFFKRDWRKQISSSEKLILIASSISLLFWILTMFIPSSTINHQGSYATNLLLMAVLGIFVSRLNKKLLFGILVVQTVIFVMSWLLTGDFLAHLNKTGILFQITLLIFLLFTIYGIPKLRISKELR